MTTEIEPHILKKFEIKKRIGKGAYGIVWKALNKKTKEIIALKKIFDAFRNQTDAQRTFREIAFLQNFGNHPNIVRLYNVIRASSDKDIYLVFEFMETDLHNVIKKGNILNDVHKQYIMYQLLKATAYLHSGEVIHRDQKPSNVLLDSYCSVKLCDFGLARSLKGRNKSETGSKVNCKTLLPALTEYVATRWYRAPEILLACHDYTKGVDIWSLGCILGEMLIGTPLFPGTSTLDQIERIMAGLPKPSAEDLASVKSPYSASILQKARIRNRRSLDQMLANVDKTATDLLYKMLHFNPYKRITALEALKHPYVRRFYCPSEIMIMSHHVTPPLDDNVQLTVSEYRDRLYQMISSKRPETMTVQQNEIQKSELIKTKQDVASIPSSMPKLKCQTAVKRFSVTLYPQNAVIKKQQPTSLSPTSPPLQPVKLKQQQLKDTNGHSTPYENEEACVQVNLKQRKHENRLKNSPDKLSSSKAKIPLGMNHSSPTSTTTATRTTSTSTAAIRATCNGGNNHSDTPITKASPQALHNHRVCKYDNTSECMTEYDKCNNISRSALNSTTPLQQYSRQQYPQPQHLADQQSRSALNSRMTYTNSPLISHNSISRSNSVNKLPMEHKTSKRYSAVSPSQYCSQYITKVSVQNSSTLSGNKLSDYSDQYNSSNSSNTCENNHAGAHQSQQNNTNNVSSASYIPPSNSRITTSNYYYFTAATTADRCSNSYSHQNIQFEDGMVTPKADNNKEDRPGNEDHHLLSQAENSLLLRDNDYLASSNDTYEENTNYLCNINHNLLHNQKYCSTSNIQNDVNNTSHHIMNTKTSNGAKDLTPKVSSLSTLEITQKVTPSVYSMPYEKNDVISKSNCQSIGHTRLEEKYISRNNTTTKNHSNSNNNHKGSVVNYSNALRIDDTVRYKTASLIQRKIDSCKLNGKYNNQSDHEPILSTVSTNQKLKLIQGSTDVQNSMFQSKISDSLNNLNSKLLKNGHHHQKQQLGEGNPHTQQSGHSSNQNGSKFTEDKFISETNSALIITIIIAKASYFSVFTSFKSSYSSSPPNPSKSS
uniref:Protein kinase domain-containing protein n=1 Tax=Trichobilharzia regenti TaxID=157069 RepID=A0AA85IW38_TRIRE|nr:unnamed protein product [Trichobilharzia regenti]